MSTRTPTSLPSSATSSLLSLASQPGALCDDEFPALSPPSPEPATLSKKARQQQHNAQLYRERKEREFEEQRVVLRREKRVRQKERKKLAKRNAAGGEIVTMEAKEDDVQAGVQTFSVFVKSFDGRTLTMDVSTSDKVEQLKVKISSKIDLSPVQQLLTYGGKLLVDHHSLSHYNIAPDSTLHLSVLLPGGAPKRRNSDLNDSTTQPIASTSAHKKSRSTKRQSGNSSEMEEGEGGEGEGNEQLDSRMRKNKRDLEDYDQQRFAELEEGIKFAKADACRLLDEHRRFRQVLPHQPPETPLERLSRISNFGHDHVHRRRLSFSPQSPVGQLLGGSKGGALVASLIKLAENPLQYAGESAVRDGLFREVDEEDLLLEWHEKEDVSTGTKGKGKGKGKEKEETSLDERKVTATAALYCRALVLKVRKLRSALERFAIERPAELPWVALMLEQIASLDEEVEVSLPYLGQSFTLTAAGRAQEDRLKTAVTRFQSFLAVNELYDYLKFYEINFPSELLTVTGSRNTLRFQFRALETLQQGEQLLISLVPYTRLNSAFGGSHPTFAPSVDLISLRDRVGQIIITPSPPNLANSRRRPLPEPFSQQDSLSKKDLRILCKAKDKAVKKVYDSNLTMWEELDPRFVKPSEFVEEEILFNARATPLNNNGHPRSISLLKDITEEALNSTPEQNVRFHNQRSGQAAKSWREFYQILRDDPSILDAPLNPSLETVREKMFGFIDLWAISRRHVDILIAIIGLLRFILRFEATVLKAYSAKMDGLLLSLGLNSIFRSDATSDDLRKFIDGDNDVLPLLFDFTLDLGTWKEQAEIDFILNDVGRIAVIPLLPETESFRSLNHWRLVTPLIHVGALKYDPTMEAPLSKIIFCSELKAHLVEEVVATLGPINTEDSLVAVRAYVESLADEIGLNTALEEAKMTYLQKTKSVIGARLRDKGREWTIEGMAERAHKFDSVEVLTEILLATKEEQEEMVRVAVPIVRSIKENFSRERSKGAPRSQTRLDQIASLVSRHKLEVRRGLRTSISAHGDAPVGSEDWRKWLEDLEENKDLYRTLRFHPASEDTSGWEKVERALSNISDAQLKLQSSLRLANDPSSPNNTLSIATSSLLNLLVDSSRPRSHVGHVKPFNREVIQVECYDCDEIWRIEGVYGVHSRAMHSCFIEPLDKSMSYSNLNKRVEVIKEGNTKRGPRRAREKIRRQARGFRNITDPDQFKLTPIYYAHQIVEHDGIENDSLPPTLQAFNAVDILRRSPNALPTLIQQQLDSVTRGGGLSSLDLGIVVDLADDCLERPSSRHDWRYHQAMVKLLIHLARPVVDDGYRGNGGVLHPAHRFSTSNAQLTYWTGAERFVTLEKMFVPVARTVTDHMKRRERDGYSGTWNFIEYAECVGETVGVYENEDSIDKVNKEFKCEGSLFKAAGPDSSMQMGHKTLPGAPESSIHHVRTEVTVDFANNSTFRPISTFLALPPLTITRFWLATWEFTAEDTCKGRMIMKRLEEEHGIKPLDW